MEDIDKQIALYMKNLIKRSPFSQKEIADKLGITSPSLSQMLSAKVPFPTKRLMQIFEIVPHDKFIFDKTNALLMEKTGLTIQAKIDNIPDELIERASIRKKFGVDIYDALKRRDYLLEKKFDTIDSENHDEVIQEIKDLSDYIDIKIKKAQTAESSVAEPRTACGVTEKPADEAIPIKRSELHEVPIISIAQAAGYDYTLEPFDDFARNCSDDTAEFTEAPDGCFALRVDGDSMSPEFPHGTILLVAAHEQYPKRGDLVVAKIRETGQVICKTYNRKDNVVTLESINPAGKNIKFHTKDNFGYLEWMYPVIEATIRIRDRRWEQKKNGFR